MFNGDYPNIEELGGKAWRIRRLVDRNVKTWGASNPSISRGGDGRLLTTIRSSNYVIAPKTGQLVVTEAGHIKARVWMSWVADDLTISEPQRVMVKDWKDFRFSRGVEDAKPFYKDGEWFFTGVVLERECRIARQALFTFDPDACTAEMVELYPGVRELKPEKNWMYIPGSDFKYVYSSDTVYSNGQFSPIKNSKKVPDSMRGTSQIVQTSIGLIGVGHHLYTDKVRLFDAETFGMRDGLLKDYTHRFVLYREDGTVEAMTDEFRFYRDGIEFGSGVVEHNGQLVVSFGRFDISANFATIDVGLVEKLLKKV